MICLDRRIVATLALLGALTACRNGVAACDPKLPNAAPVSRYQIHAGEVYDEQTHLTWQRCSVGQHWKEGLGCVGVIRQVTWQEARDRATGGWRLPSVDELKTLIASNCTNPAINEQAFPDMELDKLWYWTSTDTGSSVWYVAFGTGSVHNADRTDMNAVRLVRGRRPPQINSPAEP